MSTAATGIREGERGFALVTALVLLALVMSLLSGYFLMTQIEQLTTRSTMSGVRAFYAAEAGLNLRAEDLRPAFAGLGTPAGAAPVDNPPSQIPCQGGNVGSGDLACVTYSLEDWAVVTHVAELGGGAERAGVVPRGEPFQNLHGGELAYVVHGDARQSAFRTAAELELHVRNRRLPLFQFAAFYGKDLEVGPGAALSLSGPVHSNGDLYLAPNGAFDVQGQVTAGGILYRGEKQADSCPSLGTARVSDPATLSALPACSANRVELTAADVQPWRGMVRPGLRPPNVPPPETFDAAPGRLYWDRADLRIVLDVNGPPAIEIRTQDGLADAAKTALLTACGATTYSGSLYDNREGTAIDMLDVDLVGLLDCVHANDLMGVGKGLDDATDGGLVWYFGVDGPSSAIVNNYGVRLRNGSQLASTLMGAPAIRGLTAVSDQAVYLEGNYNTVGRKPAAVIADSLNVLSNAWSDSLSTSPLASRVASSTTIFAAVLAGTDSTGGAEGSAGQDAGGYNGGLEGFFRLHEQWSASTLAYRGSLVSLSAPRHVAGAWTLGSPVYTAPNLDWDYDAAFDDPEALPPLTPRCSYLKLEMLAQGDP